MKIIILGGTGAMGLIYGARLAATGNDVTLMDINQQAIDVINKNGVQITSKDGSVDIVRNIRGRTNTSDVDEPDFILVSTKCYRTADAIKLASPLIFPNTLVISLQNGWGNNSTNRIGKRMASLVTGSCYSRRSRCNSSRK